MPVCPCFSRGRVRRSRDFDFRTLFAIMSSLMKRWHRWLLAGILALNLLSLAHAAGPLQRVPNTTLQMPPNPPTIGYSTTNAFPGIVFTNPVCIASPPGETNRLFIVEKKGVIAVITNLAAPSRTTFMNMANKVLYLGDTSVY